MQGLFFAANFAVEIAIQNVLITKINFYAISIKWHHSGSSI